MCECVISTGVPGVLFHFQWVPSIPNTALFSLQFLSLPLSPSFSLPFSSHPLCCCCERLFAFSVDSPLCLFVFDLVFVFYLIFYSLCFEVGEDFASYSATLSDLSCLDASSR